LLGVADEPTYAIPMEEVLEGTLNFKYLDAGAEHARGCFEVGNRHKQPFGIVHGGVYAAFAEGLCSSATYLNVREGGKIAVGSSNFTSFLRPVTHGVVTAEARAIHRGRTTWVWECEFRNEDGKPCALSRVTLAVIDPPKGSDPSADSRQ
jgi:1,4-dihydroxy-2-naphthoyl-CoA hydrolase